MPEIARSSVLLEGSSPSSFQCLSCSHPPQAMMTLHHGGNPNSQKEADTYLTTFSLAPSAWDICQALFGDQVRWLHLAPAALPC